MSIFIEAKENTLRELLENLNIIVKEKPERLDYKIYIDYYLDASFEVSENEGDEYDKRIYFG